MTNTYQELNHRNVFQKYGEEKYTVTYLPKIFSSEGFVWAAGAPLRNWWSRAIALLYSCMTAGTVHMAREHWVALM